MLSAKDLDLPQILIPNVAQQPLTAFENFKARFEREISWAGEQATAFDHRIDEFEVARVRRQG